MWCRVFAINEAVPAAAEIVEHLRGCGRPVEARADTDEQGWFHLELTGADGVYLLDVYGSDEGIRDDLNTWAAWLEENAGDQAIRWMQHVIGTRRLITLRREDLGDDAAARQFCHELARWLAQQGDGVYQIDGEGFFDSAGTLLAAEPA
ncbi:MAG: hypothetical protein L0Y71_16805 [Gemmataceae bacterium]|nr:hypothetical protein [Gemmataceae bacterium]